MVKFMSRCIHVVLSCAVALLPTVSNADERSYTETQDVVYGQTHGVALVMDIFVPRGEKNGHAIVDIASGAWSSDRGKIEDHRRGQVFELMCAKGFTVFAVRPGSISKFSAAEMLANVNTGIRWVKSHADDYKIAPDALGLMGASAGGHLACLTAVTASDATRVKATGAFFPPTDFLQYGDQERDAGSTARIREMTIRLAFPDGVEGLSEKQIQEGFIAISPARLVTPDAPPFLLIHGDADLSVPLQQSKVMLAALEKAKVPAQLIIKPGGGHPWPTIHEEVQVMADWFAKQLIPSE
jgi:acetyl esterase/lipase